MYDNLFIRELSEAYSDRRWNPLKTKSGTNGVPQKPGPTSERNYGLFYPTQKKVYTVPLTLQEVKSWKDVNYGKNGGVGGGSPAVTPVVGGGGIGNVGKAGVKETWCVANGEVGESKLQTALDYACGEGGADCRPIEPGSTCFDPNTLEAHASYAFNSFYQKNNRAMGSCDFQGAAFVVYHPPHDGSRQVWLVCSRAGLQVCLLSHSRSRQSSSLLFSVDQVMQNKYDQQRLEIIKRNAQFMEARGFDKNIFQYHAETHLKHARDEDLMSSDDDATYENDESEEEIICKSKATRKQPSSNRGSMSDFMHPSPIQKEPPPHSMCQKQQHSSSNQRHQKPLFICPGTVSQTSDQQQQQFVRQQHHKPFLLGQETVFRSFEQQQQTGTPNSPGQQQPMRRSSKQQTPPTVQDVQQPMLRSSKQLAPPTVRKPSTMQDVQQTVFQSFEQQQETGTPNSPAQQQPMRRTSKQQAPPTVRQPSTMQDVQQPPVVRHSFVQQQKLNPTVQEPLGKQQKKTKQRQPTMIPQGAMSKYRDLRKQQSCGVKQLDSIRAENDFVTNESEPVENSIGDEQAIDIRQPLEETQSESVEAPNKKHRGPTKLTGVHARTLDERPTIVLNSYGQPIGPSEEVRKEFTRFLGTLARNPEFAPLHYCDWPSLPTHEKIWNYVLKKYIVPNEGKKWVMETTNESWRSYKSDIKRKYYLPYDNDESRWENRPKIISDDTFRQLLQYWSNEKIQAESEKDRNNRLLFDDMHTMGPSSYAMLRHKLSDPNKEEPSKAKVYRASRKRNPKRSYKTNFGVTKNNMEQMDAMESQEQGIDPYHEIIKKPEHGGRVRLYGKGVTKSTLKKGGKSLTYTFAPEFLQSMQTQVLEQLLDANPEVKRLLEANPGVKFVVPDVSSVVGANKSTASESYGQCSTGMHSNNEQVNDDDFQENCKENEDDDGINGVIRSEDRCHD